MDLVTIEDHDSEISCVMLAYRILFKPFIAKI